jgi:hypothetical protein
MSWFDLGYALLCAPTMASLPHLSLEPVHQRGWGSTYAALSSGRVEVERLRDLLADSLPPAGRLVSAVDVTTWPRCDAECSPERGYYYHPSRHSAGQPIVAAGPSSGSPRSASFDRDSWTTPVDAARLHPLEDTDQQAACQIRALLARLPAGEAMPRLCSTAATTLPSSPSTWPSSRPGCWCGCAQTAASTRPATSGTLTQGRPATPPRRQVQLRRPEHLASPHRHACPSG